MIDAFGIYWAGMDKLIYLPLVLVFIFFVIKQCRQAIRFARQLSHPAQQKHIFKNFTMKRQRCKAVFMVIALLFLFLALLQPQWGKKEQQVTQEGRDLLIALDISRSMLAEDFKPSRLEFAKLKIRDLVGRLPFDRVGLVLFSGDAFVQVPLTRDRATFLTLLEQIDTEVISSGTTAIDAALTKTINVYERIKERKNKIVLLITDGEDFSLKLDDVQRKAKKLGVKLFALGVATVNGAPIPIVDFNGNHLGHEKDKQGKVVLSKLNEPLLKDMSKKLHGGYVRASYGEKDVNYLVSQIEKFEKEKVAERKVVHYEDRYPWFLGIAWVLLLLEWVL